MRLDAIEKAQMIRQREKALEELRLINDRVRLNIQEFMTADAELTAVESPEPVDKAEKEEKEKKMKSNQNISKRAKKAEEGGGENYEEGENNSMSIESKKILSPELFCRKAPRTSLEPDLHYKPFLRLFCRGGERK